MISLADYRGSRPLLLGLFPGLYCPFCRRSIAQMAAVSEKLSRWASIRLPSSAPNWKTRDFISGSGPRAWRLAPTPN
jgi:peroxiredoxin